MKSTLTYTYLTETLFDFAYQYFTSEEDRDNWLLRIIQRNLQPNTTLTTVNLTNEHWNADNLICILSRNTKTITYCRGINENTKFLCEDGCHNLVGYQFLCEIAEDGNRFINMRSVGRFLMWTIRDIATGKEKNGYDSDEPFDSFINYLYDRCVGRLFEMTRIWMNCDTSNITHDMLTSFWFEDKWDCSKRLESIWRLFDASGYDNDVDGYFEEVFQEAQSNATANIISDNVDTLDTTRIDEIYGEVSTRTWEEIILLSLNDKESIDYMREWVGLTGHKRIDETLCGIHWTCELFSFPRVDMDSNEPETDWWKVGEFTDGVLWMNNSIGAYILVTPTKRILFAYF